MSVRLPPFAGAGAVGTGGVAGCGVPANSGWVFAATQPAKPWRQTKVSRPMAPLAIKALNSSVVTGPV